MSRPHELEPFKARKFAAARRPVGATVEAHALLGREDLGEIAVGAAADFVVVAGDPLEDPGLLARPALVLKAGRQL